MSKVIEIKDPPLAWSPNPCESCKQLQARLDAVDEQAWDKLKCELELHKVESDSREIPYKWKYTKQLERTKRQGQFIRDQAAEIERLKEKNLMEYLIRQMAWSLRTFGDGMRTEGLCKHIELELAEIRAEPKDLEEWVDVIQLSLDGAWRAGHTPLEICNALESKLAKNKQREWDIQKDQSKPNLHKKGGTE